MAELETISILKIDTGGAVTSIRDLRDNIKVLKDQLQDLEVGSKEYNETLAELDKNQNALKDAMKGSTEAMDGLQKVTDSTATTYNTLVSEMAKMKSQLRNIDVSTEAGKQRFKELAASINGVNDKLKEMDAMQGNYQRNVGNYASALSGLGGVLKNLPPTLGSVKEQAGKLGATMEMVGKNPVLGIIGLLAPVLKDIFAELKKNETATKAIKKALDALKPIFDLLGQVVEWLAKGIEKAVGWFVKLAGEGGGTFKKIISGAVGVGNSILQYLLTPIRTAIEAFKGLGKIVKDVFTGQFGKIKEHASEALGGIKDVVKKGFSFKANFEAGKEVGDNFVAGMGSSAAKAEEKGKEIGKATAKGVAEGLADVSIDEVEDGLGLKAEAEANKKAKALADARLKEMDKNAKHQLELNDILTDDASKKAAQQYEIQKQFNEQRLSLLQQYAQDALTRGDLTAYLDYQQQAADLEVQIATNALREKKRVDEESRKSAEAEAKARLATLTQVASGTAGLLGDIADMYEQSGKQSQKSTKQIKALRIASATIEMLNGVVTAISQAQQLGPIAGPIMAAINSAAVIAAGTANIAKIRSTQVSTSGGSTTSPTAVTAPSVTPQVQQVRTLTSATEEDRLNQMAGEQRVYILASDIEASQNARKTRVAEATF